MLSPADWAFPLIFLFRIARKGSSRACLTHFTCTPPYRQTRPEWQWLQELNNVQSCNFGEPSRILRRLIGLFRGDYDVVAVAAYYCCCIHVADVRDSIDHCLLQ